MRRFRVCCRPTGSNPDNFRFARDPLTIDSWFQMEILISHKPDVFGSLISEELKIEPTKGKHNHQPSRRMVGARTMKRQGSCRSKA